MNPVKKPKPIAAKTEIVGADWTLARQLFHSIQLHLRLSLAGQVFLGHELERLKKELGFTGSGRRKKKDAESATLTWEQYLEKEMPDLKLRSSYIFIELYQAARTKLKKLGHTKALSLLDKPSSQLTKPQHKQLETLTEKITHGETQASLLEELKIAKAQQKTTIGGAVTKTAKKPKATMEQLALALFTEPVQQLCKLRANSSYKKAIHALPLTSEDPEVVTLSSLKQQAESWNKEITTAMEKAMKENS